MRKVGIAALAMAAALFWAVRAMATPVVVDLHPIADRIPRLSGQVAISCNTLRGTEYQLTVRNLPRNDFSLVLHGSQSDVNLGTIHVVSDREETSTTFYVLMDCPLGTYSQILVMNGTRQVLIGNLPPR